MNVCFKLIGKGLLYKYEAKNIGKAILIISDVCSVKKPRSNHLFAPLISLPKIIVANIKTIAINMNKLEKIL